MFSINRNSKSEVRWSSFLCKRGNSKKLNFTSHRPGSTNTVPGYVQFSLDIRSREDAKVLELEKRLKDEFEKIARGEEIHGTNTMGTKGKGCSVDWQLDTKSPATKFHEDCIKCVETSAADLMGAESKNLTQRMTSGAGHDRWVRVLKKNNPH